MFKKIFNCLTWFFILLLVGTLVLTLFNYFNIINSKVISIMKFILPVISMFISSYRLGKLSDKKGYKVLEDIANKLINDKEVRK